MYHKQIDYKQLKKQQPQRRKGRKHPKPPDYALWATGDPMTLL